MKALTIKEPWASLIIEKYKEYEFRTWKTKYRGKILIHAGGSLEKEMLKKIQNYNIEPRMGHIIGEVMITDCILVDDKFNEELKKKDSNVYRGNYVGLYAWKIENVKKYECPIPYKGKLSLWNYEEEKITNQ